MWVKVVENILQVENLTKHFVKKGVFGRNASVTKASDGVSFNVKRGKVFVLAGESGSGKSTIAKMILGSIRPDAGRIVFEGKEVEYGKESMNIIRTRCQMIHQDPYDSINPRMRISDIIAEPLEIHNTYDTKEQISERVAKVLEEVRLQPAEEIAAKHPHMLSGGQRQRVVLARALALRPKIIVADEPVSMLDVSIRAEMLEMMRDLQSKYGISFVYITHDLATAKSFGQNIAILYRGKIVEYGDMDNVLVTPRHPYTQALIDAISEPDPRNLYRKKRIRIVGEKEELVTINKNDNTQLHAVVQKTGLLSPSEMNVKTKNGCRFAPRCPYVADVCKTEPALEEKGEQQHQSMHKAACHIDIQTSQIQ